MRILLNEAARAWQWRRVALREGYEGLSRGAVVTPLFAALRQLPAELPRAGLLALGCC